MEEDKEKKKEKGQKVLTNPLKSYLLAGLLLFLAVIVEAEVPTLLWLLCYLGLCK